MGGSGGRGGGIEGAKESKSSLSSNAKPDVGMGGRGGGAPRIPPGCCLITCWMSIPSSSRTASLLPGTKRSSFLISETRLGTGNEAKSPAMRLVATSIVVLLHTLQGTNSDTALICDWSSFDLGRVISSSIGTEP